MRSLSLPGLVFFTSTALSAACAHAPQTAAPPTLSPPSTASASAVSSTYVASRTSDAKDVLFGTVVADPYRWLEDAKAPEVAKWMKDQDDFARARLAAYPEAAAIETRMKELVYVDVQDAPKKAGDRLFFTRRAKDEEKTALFYRGADGVDHALIDPNAFPPEQSAALQVWSPSPDGKKLAYTLARNNTDAASMYLVDVESGKPLEPTPIAGAGFALAQWTPSGDGFYYPYTPEDPAIAPADRAGYTEIRFHHLGDDATRDKVVHAKTGDPKVELDVTLSRDGRWLLIWVSRGEHSDVYFRDVRDGVPEATAALTPLVVGGDARFDVQVHRGKFYIMTNDGAPHSRLYVASPSKPDRASWIEAVAERPDATLERFRIVDNHLVLGYMKDVATTLEEHTMDGAFTRQLSLPAVGTVSAIQGDPDEGDAYIAFTSFTYPDEIRTVSMKTGSGSVWFKTTLPVDPSRFAVTQVFYPSKDGTKVPMFIVAPKDDATAPRAPRPLLLRGYGGFDLAQRPHFQSELYPWLERGGVYALANIRGGDELGEDWHRAGMLHAKQNVFDDFAAAGEYLVHEGYTSTDKLAIYGRSNGGLLVGAALTQRPDLFRVALCEVPLLDMIRYPKFGDGPFWVAEYGSPDKEDDFRALFAYSPYHHVTKGTKYPSVLMLSADSDDRVDPMHARKLAAELQAATTGGPVLLRIEHASGHSGNATRRAWVKKIADEYAFALGEIAKSPN